MNAYLDASVLVSVFVDDAHTALATRWLARSQTRITLSEWTLAEFTSALGIAVRIGRLSALERDDAHRALDAWLATQRIAYALASGDALRARSLILASASPLRGGDALHLAIAEREGCSMASFDVRMRSAAAALGLPVEDLSPHG